MMKLGQKVKGRNTGCRTMEMSHPKVSRLGESAVSVYITAGQNQFGLSATFSPSRLIPFDVFILAGHAWRGLYRVITHAWNYRLTDWLTLCTVLLRLSLNLLFLIHDGHYWYEVAMGLSIRRHRKTLHTVKNTNTQRQPWEPTLNKCVTSFTMFFGCRNNNFKRLKLILFQYNLNAITRFVWWL